MLQDEMPVSSIDAPSSKKWHILSAAQTLNIEDATT